MPNRRGNEDVAGLLDGVQREEVTFIPDEPAELMRLLDRARAEGKKRPFKYGIDPTAAHMHLGHILGLVRARLAQDLGHVVALVIGDATASIGDPTGRDSTRPALSPEEIDRNVAAFMEQAGCVLDQDPEKLQIHKNSEWFGKWDLARGLEFFSDYSLADLLAAAKYRVRDERADPIRLHELVYKLLQGWDSVELDAAVELGGADQLLNTTQGRKMQEVESSKRKEEAKKREDEAGVKKEEEYLPQAILLMPLLMGLDGRKMSKSKGNTINLTDPPERIYRAVMEMPDALIPMYMRYLILMYAAEREEMLQRYSKRELTSLQMKRFIAERVVGQLHSDEAAVAAAGTYSDAEYHPNDTVLLEEREDKLKDAYAIYRGICLMPNILWPKWYIEHQFQGTEEEKENLRKMSKDPLQVEEMKRIIARNVVARLCGEEWVEAAEHAFKTNARWASTVAGRETKYVKKFSCVPMLLPSCDGMEVSLPPRGLEDKLEWHAPLMIKLQINPKRPHYHLGHVAILQRLAELQKEGHKVVIVVDDFGAKAPVSSRRVTQDAMMAPLSEEASAQNTNLALKQIGKIVDLDTAEVRHTSEWLSGMKFMDLIKLLQQHTLQELLGPPHNRTELGRRYDAKEPIFMDEVIQFILHGVTSEKIGSDVEIGVQGKELRYWMGRTRQRLAGQIGQVVLLPPMLPGKDGKLMATEHRNTISFEASPEELFTQLMLIRDEDLVRFIRAFIPDPEQQADLMSRWRAVEGAEILVTKKIVVEALVERFHGAEVAQGAKSAFEKKQMGQVEELECSSLALKEGATITVDVLVRAIGKFKNVADWKRLQVIADNLVPNGVISIDGVTVTDSKRELVLRSGLRVKIGKKHFVLKV